MKRESKIADVLTCLRGLRPKNLIGATFGSYGWSGESARQINDMLSEMKVDLIAEPFRVKYVPDRDTLSQCFDLGLQIAERLKEAVKNG